MSEAMMGTSPETLKACCAAAYGSDSMRWLLGDSFHPGGLALTEHLGNLLPFSAADRVLDVASGRGDSALHLARTFGCEVIGVDLSAANVEFARAASRDAGLAARVQFQLGDAEHLEFVDASFDALLCECAFCTFPSKEQGAAEFVRVLRPGGRIGLSDLTRWGPLPRELQTLMAWISCIADAQPLDEYLRYIRDAGFVDRQTEDHGDKLAQMVRQVRLRLLGGQLFTKLQGFDLGGVDFAPASTMARHAAEAIDAGLLGYALITARKPGGLQESPPAEVGPAPRQP
jgi:arsenite methyltransferase